MLNRHTGKEKTPPTLPLTERRFSKRLNDKLIDQYRNTGVYVSRLLTQKEIKQINTTAKKLLATLLES